MAWVGVVTDAGAAVLNNYVSGTTLNISKIVTGTGYVNTEALMRARTALVSPEDEGDVVGLEPVTGGVQFSMQVGPNAGEEAYLMKEIGLMVEVVSGGSTTEVLLAYFCLSEGVSIPVAANFPDFVYTVAATLAIDNETPFTLTVNSAALVSQATLAAARAALEALIAEKVAIEQGVANARKFLVVDAEGNVSPALVLMQGATALEAGKAGLVPAPLVADIDKFLGADGTWKMPPDTKYTQGSGISINGTVISLSDSGAVANTYGPSQDVIGDNGAEILIPVLAIDAKGRVTTAGTKKLTLKNTTYTNGAGLELNGTVFSLGLSGVTAATYGPTQNVTGNNNATIKIPQIQVDQYGRVTSIVERTLTCKDTTSYLPLAGGTVTGVTTFSNTTAASSTTTGAVKIGGGLGVAGNIYGNKVFGAVWNDYAEYRKGVTSAGGHCLMECPDGYMRPTTKRLQAGCRLTSDTFGQCIGETDEAKTPIAVSGRVLAYPYGDIRDFHVGDAVCSAPGGKISKMSRREIRKWPDRIIGIVSEIPHYPVWIGGTKENPEEIQVNGRIWVYVR